MAQPQQKPAQTDPWEVEAKNFKPSPGGGQTAPAEGGDDWKVWQGGGGQSSGSDSDTFAGGARNVLSRVGSNIGAMAKPFMQSPAKTLEDITSRQGSLMRGEAPPDVFSDFAHTYSQDKPKAFENLGGDLATAGLIYGLPKAFGAAKTGIQNFRPTSSPEIVPPIQTAAEKLAGSIVPKKNQIPGFVNDIQRNAGNIRDFVKESNNPLRTQAEFEKAVQGAGNKRYEHFNQNILGPVADQPVPVPKVFGGETTGEGTATLGSINNRIGRLNQVMSPGYAKANPGDVATVFAKTPMETLQAEHAQITPAFHEALSQATGIPVEDIANLRQDFGSLRGLGNTVTEARAGRIGKVGAGNEGATMPASKAGVLDKIWTTLHGGQDAMANRALQKAWKGIEPLAGESRPLPQSPENFQAQRAFQESANQEAARAEAARMHESEIAAQDAAQQRSGVADMLRKSNVDIQKQAAQAEAARMHQGETAAQDAAAQRSQITQGRRAQRASVYRGTANVEATNAAEREAAAQQAAADRAQQARKLRSK